MYRPRKKKVKPSLKSPVSIISSLNDSMTRSDFEDLSISASKPSTSLSSIRNTPIQGPSVLPARGSVTRSGKKFKYHSPILEEGNSMRAAPDQPPQTYYGHGRSVQRDEYSGDGSEISNWTSHNSELSLRSSNRARASSSQGIQGSRTISSDRSLEHLYGLDQDDADSYLESISWIDGKTEANVSEISNATGTSDSDTRTSFSSVHSSKRISDFLNGTFTACYYWLEGFMFHLLLNDLHLLNWTCGIRKWTGAATTVFLVIIIPILFSATFCTYKNGSFQGDSSHPIAETKETKNSHATPPTTNSDVQAHKDIDNFISGQLAEHEALKSQVERLQSQIEALQQQECHYQTDNGSNHHLQQQLMWLAEQEAIRRKNDHELHDKLNDLSQMVNISLAPNTHNLLATIDNYVEEVLKGYLKEVVIAVNENLSIYPESSYPHEGDSSHNITRQIIKDLLLWIENKFVKLKEEQSNITGKLTVMKQTIKDELTTTIANSHEQMIDTMEQMFSQLESKSENVSKTTSSPLKVNVSSGLRKKEIEHIIDQSLELYSADRTGQADFALESSGGSIISIRNTETLGGKLAVLSFFGIPLWYSGHSSPRAILQPDVLPGHCWAFHGSQGAVVIKLARPVRPTIFSLEHIPESLSPEGNILAAPRAFTVWGIITESDESGILLGNYTYSTSHVHSLQQFPSQGNAQRQFFRFVELKIHSNHGNLDYTCIYRFRVHGSLHD